MADNTVINLGSGGDVIATDDIDGVKYQRVKMTVGADGVTTGDVSKANPLPVQLPAGEVDSFGRVFTASQSNAIDVNFALNAPTTFCAVTTASGGTAATVNGALEMTTTTTTGSSATVTSFSKIQYIAGGEVFILFTTAFTPGVADTLQRIGAFDTQNGMFLQYNGTAFEFVVRQAGTDGAIAIGSWNVDSLTGATGSLYTRDGVPEAIDLENLNVWRIRFGWLGAAPIKLEVVSPDGEWVLCNIVRQPNTSPNPHIFATDLPMRAEVTNSASTALTFRSACWGAGSTSVAQDTTQQDIRLYATSITAAATGVEAMLTLTRSTGFAANTTGTSFVVTRGKRLRITAITFATRGPTPASAQVTTFNIRVNPAGAVVATSAPVLVAIRCATPATALSWDRAVVTLPTDGIEIQGDGVIELGVSAVSVYGGNAPTLDVTIFGYEY